MPDPPHDRPTRPGLLRLLERSRISPLVVLGLSLGATAVVTAYVWRSAESRDRLRFESQVQPTVTGLDHRLDAYIDILIGGTGLFAASDQVSAEEFARYVNSLRVQERYPGVQGVGFSARVPLAARDSLVRAQRSAGFAEFRTWPEPDGDAVHSIVYLLPQDERNREAMGYDMYSNPVRREAMERARDTGAPAASGRVTLVQEIDEDVQPGFLVYVPVYRGGGIPATVDERRDRLQGFVYSPFRARDLLRGLVEPSAPVELQVYDGPTDDPEALLFDSRLAESPGPPQEPRFRTVVPLGVAGQTWTVAVEDGPAFEASSNRRLAPLALALGLLTSGALFVLTAAEARAYRRAERTAWTLQASETQYRLAFEANPQPMWVYDVETLDFLAVNDAAVRQYGYSREEFADMTIRDIRPPEDVPGLETWIARRSEDTDRSGPWRHVTSDGSTRLVEISANDLDFAGRRGRLVCAQDVTERVRSRADLEEAQERMKRILSLSTAVIYTMDVRGHEIVPTWVTTNLPRVTGYSVEEGLAPGWWFDHIHPEERERVAAIGPDLLDRGQRTIEYRLRHADGHYVWIRDDAVVRRDDEERPVEVIGAWLDVTERRQLAEQLQQAQKMEAVGRLAGGIAHDFNNLLTVIRSQSDLLLLDLEPGDGRPGDLANEIELIQQAADRAATLTGQLLAFSRDQVLRPRLVDPARTIRGLGELLSRLLGEGVRVVHELPEGLAPIEVDPGPLEQAVLNLAVNARDAMSGSGTLTFSASMEQVGAAEAEGLGGVAPGLYTVLHVADTGSGMDAETRGRIFEPFFTTKPKGRGTGLGLAMVYGFIRQSRGAIRVESEPARGSTFHLYFPAAYGPVAAVGDASAPRRDPGELRASGTVLLVEDEASVRRATRRILERSGLEVVDVGTAEAGLEALDDGDGFDLVLTDLVLPGMSGRDLVDRLGERTPRVPVILMSGYEERSPTSRTELPLDVAFVAKPFTVTDLLEAVQRALG